MQMAKLELVTCNLQNQRFYFLGGFLGPQSQWDLWKNSINTFLPDEAII